MTGGGVEAAPAKINLCLHVTGRRADGYHLLSSLVAFADVHDSLSYRPGDGLRLTIDGPEAASLPAGPDNLVLRAARALANVGGVAPTGDLVLTKRLPVASGIGGGSADAAAALRLLARAWALDAATEDLAAIALDLGADVPMCLAGRPALAAGIGEQLALLPDLPSLDLLLVNPRRPVSTPDVFRARSGDFGSDVGAVPTGSRAALVDWLGRQRNDLETPASTVEPSIRAALDILSAQTGCRLARMSGSGATCFGLFDDRETAAQAATAIRRRRPDWWIVAGRTLADGEQAATAQS